MLRDSTLRELALSNASGTFAPLHTFRNCWPGQGATAVIGDQGSQEDKPSRCQRRCNRHPDCAGVSVSKVRPGFKWHPVACTLLAKVDLKKCVRGKTGRYQTWIRVPGKARWRESMTRQLGCFPVPATSHVWIGSAYAPEGVYLRSCDGPKLCATALRNDILEKGAHELLHWALLPSEVSVIRHIWPSHYMPG